MVAVESSPNRELLIAVLCEKFPRDAKDGKRSLSAPGRSRSSAKIEGNRVCGCCWGAPPSDAELRAKMCSKETWRPRRRREFRLG
jgi:hypothetical protein